MKATPTLIASNQDELCPMSFSNAGDIMMTSSGQNKGMYVYYSAPTNKDPPEGKTTAVIAVMRGKPKMVATAPAVTSTTSKKIARVLLDSGSDGDLIFVNKDKPILLPYLKKLIQQLRNTSNGIF
jgi:hypothetical protein